jgi:hypothetical protein
MGMKPLSSNDALAPKFEPAAGSTGIPGSTPFAF